MVVISVGAGRLDLPACPVPHDRGRRRDDRGGGRCRGYRGRGAYTTLVGDVFDVRIEADARGGTPPTPAVSEAADRYRLISYPLPAKAGR
jgi:hypothetical protein